MKRGQRHQAAKLPGPCRSGRLIVPDCGIRGGAGQPMAKLSGLGGQIVRVELRARCNVFDPFSLNVELFHGVQLATIVGHELERPYAKVSEHGITHSVVAKVIGKSKLMVGFHGICAILLKCVGANFVDQAYASAFLSQIKQYASSLLGDALQGAFELCAAVATLTEERVSGQAFRVESCQYRFAIADVSQHHGQMFFARTLFHEGMQPKTGPGRGQGTAGNMLDLWVQGWRRLGSFSVLHGYGQSSCVQKTMRRRELSRSPHCRGSGQIMPQSAWRWFSGHLRVQN